MAGETTDGVLRLLKKIKINNQEFTIDSGSSTGSSKNNVLIITEDNVTVKKDSTKGVDPYNTSYGHTNITVNNVSESDITEGIMIAPVIVSSLVVGSSYRNIRIRFGESGRWIPVMSTTAILTGNNFFKKDVYRLYQYRTDVINTGAFHMMTDSNTTYSVMPSDEANVGTATTGRLVSAQLLKSILDNRLSEVSSTGSTPELHIIEGSSLSLSSSDFGADYILAGLATNISIEEPDQLDNIETNIWFITHPSGVTVTYSSNYGTIGQMDFKGGKKYIMSIKFGTIIAKEVTV